jgi:hypothetical protein
MGEVQMKCSKCKQDYAYLEMQPFPITDREGNTIYPRRTYLMCKKCLGWETPQRVTKTENGETLVRIRPR